MDRKGTLGPRSTAAGAAACVRRASPWLGAAVPVALLALAASTARAAPDPGGHGASSAAAEARARVVLGEIQQINDDLNHAAEQWNAGRLRLAGLERTERVTRAQLRRIERDYRIAERRLGRLVVAIYTADDPTALDAILGATSVGDLLDRLDTANRVEKANSDLVRQTNALRVRFAERTRRLRRAVLAQRRTVRELDARRAAIRRQLGERQRLLGTIRSEIAVLKAREAARQRRLAAEARARVAAEERARLLAEREQARRDAQRVAAAKAAAATPAAPTTETTTTTATPPPPAPPATTEDLSRLSVPAATEPAPATQTTTDTTSTDSTTPAEPPPPAPEPETSTEPAPPETTEAAGLTVAEPAAPLPPGHPETASIALRYLGIPYRWGGASPSAGFDCSGLVMYVYAQVGITLPHSSYALYGLGTAVPASSLQAGDLVFFDGLDHMGIYIGGGQYVHAPHTGAVVRIGTMGDPWVAAHYVGARRI